MIQEKSKKDIGEGIFYANYDSEYYTFTISTIDKRLTSFTAHPKKYLYPEIMYNAKENNVHFRFSDMAMFYPHEIDAMKLNLDIAERFAMNELLPFVKSWKWDMNIVYVSAAVIRSVDKDGNDIILCTQRGYGDYESKWEFPGGKIEMGETPQEALKREIKEELKADIIVKDIITIAEYDYPVFHLLMRCYWCELVNNEYTLLEHKAAKWAKISELDDIDWLPADKLVVDKIKNCQ